MPNWCEGTLKVRGKKNNLENFILNGLKPVNCLGEDQDSLKLNEYNDIHFEGTAWIEGTQRGFVKYMDVYLSELEREEGEPDPVICLDTKFAWFIDAEHLSEISKKYNVDFKILGFERGMEFNQDIEIIKGQIVKNVEIKFDDYEWECINPTLGG